MSDTASINSSNTVSNSNLKFESQYFSDHIHQHYGPTTYVDQSKATETSPYGNVTITDVSHIELNDNHLGAIFTYKVSDGNNNVFEFKDHYNFNQNGYNIVEEFRSINGGPTEVFHYNSHAGLIYGA